MKCNDSLKTYCVASYKNRLTTLINKSIESHRVLSLHRNMVYLSKNDIYIVRIYREIMGRVCETEVLSIFAEVMSGRAN